jgi:hypothetical protein
LNRPGWTIRETVEWEFGRGSGRTRANRGRECHNHGLESEDSADFAGRRSPSKSPITLLTMVSRGRWRRCTNCSSGGTIRTTRDRGKQLYPSMWPIVMAGYRARGGKDPDLPGTGAVSGSGRVDLRLAVDRSGELYLLSKSDGVIRAVIGASAAPDTFKQAARPEQYRIP